MYTSVSSNVINFYEYIYIEFIKMDQDFNGCTFEAFIVFLSSRIKLIAVLFKFRAFDSNLELLIQI